MTDSTSRAPPPPPTPGPAQITGGCLCGSVRFSVAPGAEPVYNVICHCLNCKKASGAHVTTSSIFLKSQFTLDPSPSSGSSTLKTYHDPATDSGRPLHRHFCSACGSPVYITTPLAESIVSVRGGCFDPTDSGADLWWRPNKEQYIATKSHWLPDFPLDPKEGVVERHRRGAVGDGQGLPSLPPS